MNDADPETGLAIANAAWNPSARCVPTGSARNGLGTLGGEVGASGDRLVSGRRELTRWKTRRLAQVDGGRGVGCRRSAGGPASACVVVSAVVAAAAVGCGSGVIELAKRSTMRLGNGRFDLSADRLIDSQRPSRREAADPQPRGLRSVGL
jgi:hypothetical protein